MTDHHKDIGMRLGAAVVAISQEYLPVVLQSMLETGKPISFGVTVSFTKDKKSGLIAGSVRTRAPKIPTADMDPMNFVLQVEQSGQQMEFLFAGTPTEMLAGIAENEKPAIPEDGYQGGDNASSREASA